MEDAQAEKEAFFNKLDRKSKRTQLKMIFELKMLSDKLQVTKRQTTQTTNIGVKQFAFMERDVSNNIDPWSAHLFDQYIRPAEKHVIQVLKAQQTGADNKKVPAAFPSSSLPSSAIN